MPTPAAALNTFIPNVFYRDPLAALHWLEAAFGFRTNLVVTDPSGAVGHAETSFEGGTVNVGGEWSDPAQLGLARFRSPASTDGVATQHVRVVLKNGIDAHCGRARAAGARITLEPADQFYGARVYRALDLEGHVWTFEQVTRILSLDEMAKASGLSLRDHL
jgi:uncharacterized glyoxalase superfamily protein PhnB